MLPQKQEKLLLHLRKQLEIFSKAGILSEEQKKIFGKLSTTHDEATKINDVILPANDKSFEIQSKIAFPQKVTAEELQVQSLDSCRIKLGFSPVLPVRNRRQTMEDLTRLTGDGWDVMPSQLNFDDDESHLSNNSIAGLENLRNNISAENLPSLYEIEDPPSKHADDIIDYIQDNQNERCGNCKKKIERKSLGLGSYKARWCHEMNQFCCEACNDGTAKCVLPAYAMLRWDFEPKIVRNSYGIDAEFEYQKPLLVPGAENPLLFEQVPILQDLRRLRFQLSKLYDIGSSCKDFVRSLTTEPEKPVLGVSAATQAALASNRRAAFFISERQRYLIHDSEMWSLRDLEQVYRACPQKMTPGPQALQASREMIQKSQFAKFLQSVRDSMIRHVLSECNDCKLRAAHNCLECGADQPIYSFDVRNCYECTRCHSVFHRKCWEGIQKQDETCPGCAAAAKENHK